jgi:VCBS repeat-containing protein
MKTQAEREQDIIRVNCLNTKLAEVNANLRNAKSRLNSLRQETDKQLVMQAFTVMIVLGQKFDTLDQEANQCVGQNVFEPGATKVDTEISSNSCLPNPCKNDGTCKIKGSGYECECLIGYSGKNCETIDIVAPPVSPVALPPPDTTSTVSIAAEGDKQEVKENSGTSLNFTVSLNPAASKDLSIPYIITGVDTNDINEALTGNVAFKKGDTTKDLLLTIKNDDVVEKDETLTITLGKMPDGATLDDKKKSASGTIINDDNSAPVAKDDKATVNEDASVEIDVLKNDTDADKDKLSITGTPTAENGTVSITVDKLTYNPKANFNGDDIFEYNISDGKGGSAKAKVLITVNAVNDAPVVKKKIPDQEITAGVAAEEGMTFDLHSDVFFDADRDDLTFTVKGFPKNAGDRNAVEINRFSEIVTVLDIRPEHITRSGEYDITITANDGKGGEVSTTFKLTVKSNKKPPVAKDYSFTVKEDTKEETTFTIFDNSNVSENESVSFVSDSVSKTENAEYTGINNGVSGGTIGYVPKANFNGTDTFTYEIQNSTGLTAKGTVTVTVTPVNDAPTAKDDIETLSADSKSTVIKVLENDTDPDTKDKLSVTKIDKTGTKGYVGLTNGVISYDPNNKFNDLEKGKSDTDTFSYTVSDGNGGTATAKVTITIEGVKEIPLACPDNCNDRGQCNNGQCECNVGYDGNSCAKVIAPSGGTVTTSKSQVDSEATITVSSSNWISATESTLSYTWSATCEDGLGQDSFNDNKSEVEWTAPINNTGKVRKCTLSVEVKDRGNDGTASASTDISVNAATITTETSCVAPTPIKCSDNSCKATQAECLTTLTTTTTSQCLDSNNKDGECVACRSGLVVIGGYCVESSVATKPIIITITPPTSLEVNEGTGEGNTNLKFSAKSSRPFDGKVTVRYEVRGIEENPVDSTDISLGIASVSLNNGETKEFSILIKKDETFEPDETFVINFLDISASTPNGRRMRNSETKEVIELKFSEDNPAFKGTILNDDKKTASLGLANTSITKKEGEDGESTIYSFPLILEGFPRDVNTKITYDIRGEGLKTTDFSGGKLTGIEMVMPATVDSANIEVGVVDNEIIEGDKTFEVVITKLSEGVTLKTSGVAKGTILNDDFLPAASIYLQFLDDATYIQEGGRISEGINGDFILGVSLDKAASNDLSIPYTISGHEEGDFTILSTGTLKIEKGGLKGGIRIYTNDDDIVEKDKTITFTLGIPPQGIKLGDKKSITVTLKDDDKSSVSIGEPSSPSAKESKDSTFIFPVMLHHGTLNETFGITYTISGTGITADDFEDGLTGTVTIEAGLKNATIVLKVKDDNLIEGDEKFTVTLGDAPTDVYLDVKKSAIGTILNDDFLTVSIADPVTKELAEDTKDPFTFPLKLEGFPTSADVNIDYTLKGEGITADDFADGKLQGTITIKKGEKTGKIELKLKHSDDKEQDETFSIKINQSKTGELADLIKLGNDSAEGTIKEVGIDDCPVNACLNGGTCKDEIDTYSCECAAGYEGENCGIDIDDCIPNQCQNGGQCTDGVDSYSCECTAGFEGKSCETITNSPPVVKKEIADQELTVGESLAIEVKDVFNDIDGDELTYEFERKKSESLNLKVNKGPIPGTGAIVSKNFTEEDIDTHTIKVIANDGKGGEVSTSFKLTVKPKLSDEKLVTSCVAPTPFTCSDGTCRALQAECATTSSATSCPSGQVMCTDGSCVASTTSCPTTTSVTTSSSKMTTESKVVKKLVSVSLKDGKTEITEGKDKEITFTISLSCPKDKPVECSASTCASNASECNQ